MTKRHKFLITSALLSLGFIGINLFEVQFRFIGVGALTALTLLLFAWSLWEGLGINATLLTLVLPSLFTLGVGLFWFLLPTSVLARLPIVILYAIGVYALGLTSNIYTVSAIRTIALLRAAKGVGFVLTLFTSALLFNAVVSLKIPVLLIAVLTFLVSFPLFLQGLWTSKLSRDLEPSLLAQSGIFSYGVALVGTLLHFWPVSVVSGSVFMTTAVYVLLGLGQAKGEGRLFKQTVREYLVVGVLVFIVLLFSTNWRS